MTDKFSPEFITQQRELESKSTAKPWVRYRAFNIVSDHEERGIAGCGGYDGFNQCAAHQNMANAAYITAAANNYPAALTAIEERDKVIARLRNPWIPVSERLPECDLGMASHYVEVAYRIPGSPSYMRGNFQYWEKYGWVYGWEANRAVTFDDYGYSVEFWKSPSPLPEPPIKAAA